MIFRFIKRTLLVTLGLVVIMSFSMAAFGSSYYGFDKSVGVNLSAETWYTTGHKTNDKWAKMCWLRIIEGPDTTYKYTKTLTSSQAKGTSVGKQMCSGSQKNNLLKSQDFDHNWKYL